MHDNVFITINVKAIKLNLSAIINRIDASRLFVVFKSNFYGFGQELATYLIKTGIHCTFCDTGEYLLFRNKIPLNSKILILYPCFCEHLADVIQDKRVYFTLLDMEDVNFIVQYKLSQRTYIRIDPFLGGHGLTFEQAIKVKQNIDDLYGILIHINEYLEQNEKNLLYKIINWAKEEHLKVNIGGSTVLNDYFNEEHIEYRLSMHLLGGRDNHSFNTNLFHLHARILKILHIQSSMDIGYKSNRVELSKGTVLLVGLGYGQFPFLSQFFLNNISVFYKGSSFRLPCYPCMNTSWLYNPNGLILDKSYIVLGNQENSFARVAELLDVDLDEIYTSLSPRIPRIMST